MVQNPVKKRRLLLESKFEKNGVCIIYNFMKLTFGKFPKKRKGNNIRPVRNRNSLGDITDHKVITTY